MLYRSFPQCGSSISRVSFGTMRWPSEEVCHRVINHGLDRGLNYADCSTGYVNGRSQVWVARAIAKRRNEILVSSKTSFAQAPAADQARARIEQSLRDAGLDYFDFYQLWGLSDPEVLQAALARGGFVEGVRKAQRDGLIRIGLGFTFHGSGALFRAAIDTGEFVAATVSYNLMNRKEEDNIAYAAGRGVGIVVMNPLAGGILGLAGDPSLDFLRGGAAGPCPGALRFLHANPAITTAIVGFRAVPEVDQAVASLDGADRLTEDGRQDQMRRMDAVKLIEGQFCTGCGYCKECPAGFQPSVYMQHMRDFVRYGVAPERLTEWIHSRYAHQDIVAELGKCTECGRCEKECPQHLPIVEQIRKGKLALGVKPRNDVGFDIPGCM
jgi:predicted aldo/keto reductase-like oxidoreductase